MKLVFVGAGPANIFPILYLLHNNYKGSITLIDKGKDIFTREESELLNGAGGAGTYSDSKFVFSNHQDQPIFEFTNLDNIKKYYNFIQDMIIKFHPNPELINISLPEELSDELTKNGVKNNFESGWGELSIKQSTTWHVGSTYGKIILQNWFNFISNNGVKLKFETDFIDIKNNEVITNKGNYTFDKCYLALGKVGKKDLQVFYNNKNIISNVIDMNLGVRFETPYDDNENIQKLVEKQYDFKFSKDLNKDKNIRTFCSCHGSSQVVAENFNNKIRVNGHGYGLHVKDKWSGNSNFGILINEKINNDEFISKIMEKYPNGFRVSHNDDFEVTLDNIPNINVEEFKDLYKEYSTDILNFIDDLEKILQIKKYRFYGPEIKESANRVNLSPDLEITGLPNVYSIGDSGIGTRGIVPAACSGMIAVENICN